MDAPLSDCIIEEQRIALRFLSAKEIKPAEILVLAPYGACAMNQRNVYEWVERYKARKSVMDESGTGRPSALRTEEHTQRVNALIRENRRITFTLVAAILGLKDQHDHCA